MISKDIYFKFNTEDIFRKNVQHNFRTCKLFSLFPRCQCLPLDMFCEELSLASNFKEILTFLTQERKMMNYTTTYIIMTAPTLLFVKNEL